MKYHRRLGLVRLMCALVFLSTLALGYGWGYSTTFTNRIRHRSITTGVLAKPRRAARQSLAHGDMASAWLGRVDRRDLLDAGAASGPVQQRGSLCRVDGNGVCELDDGFTTTLGPPATDTQR